LKAQKTELEAQLKASRDAVINVPNLERFIEDIHKRLPELDYEGKRLALDMLNITVWLDGENVEITGTIDTGIVLTPLFASYSPSGGGGKRKEESDCFAPLAMTEGVAGCISHGISS